MLNKLLLKRPLNFIEKYYFLADLLKMSNIDNKIISVTNMALHT